MCAFCESNPCEHITELFVGYSLLKHDNYFLREKGWESWVKHQEERKEKGVGLAYVKDTNK